MGKKVAMTLTILGGRARSAALPSLVRLNTMVFRILSFSKIMALLPSLYIDVFCIGLAIN